MSNVVRPNVQLLQGVQISESPRDFCKMAVCKMHLSERIPLTPKGVVADGQSHVVVEIQVLQADVRKQAIRDDKA